MKLKVKKLSDLATLPAYATSGAAGFDIRAIEVPIEGVTITQDSPKIFRTGLAFEVPLGWALLINSRSGHGFNSDIRLGNCQGILDADFRGELKIKLAADGKDFVVQPGERIAQGLLVQAPQVEFEEVDELSETDRGTGGFGSTGKS